MNDRARVAAGEGVVLGPLPQEWPEAARSFYEERAAIIEHCARMPRERAEAAALELTRDRWRRGLL